MSAAQSHTKLKTKLEALECHFTWDFKSTISELLLIRDNLVDFGHPANQWLGHMYNLEGYIHYKLSLEHYKGSKIEDVARCFRRAIEAVRQIRSTVSDEGPWLLVNYGNMAWLHFILSEEDLSQSYLAKVEALLQQHPSPSEGELHSEVYAEKAWAFMKFSSDDKVKAAEYFQKALGMEPDRVEWNTSHALALSMSADNPTPEQQAEILQKLTMAKEHDPDNRYLAGRYLWRLANTGKEIEEEAREFKTRVLQEPINADSGISQLLRIYRIYLSHDEAITLAEAALERHPKDRYLIRCLATCYKWKIFLDKDNPLTKRMTDRAISLHEEAISLYPYTSLPIKINLANVCAELKDNARANQIYEGELLSCRLDPSEQQRLYNRYANHLNHHLRDSYKSVRYHMKAAEIPQPSKHRSNSIRILKKIQEKGIHPMCREIQSFLANPRTVLTLIT